MTKEEKIQELERMFKNCPEILTPMKASRFAPIGKNGIRFIRRTEMDLQEETAMPMGASQSPHHQRMAYQIFRQPRTLHYPQVKYSSTSTAKILFSILNKKHPQSSRFADAFLLKSLYHVLNE